MTVAIDRSARVDEYRRQSACADNLVLSGKKDEAISLLRNCQTEAARAGDHDYELFFEEEVVANTEPDVQIQIAFLDQAQQWGIREHLPVDSFLLRQKGICFSISGDEDAAIACYDQALAINPQDYDAYREKGVALSKKGDEDAALACFDQALAINPQDYETIRNNTPVQKRF